MVTNFHTPKSTLDDGIAFADPDFIKEAYEVAIEKYNFYSYGDAMLILKPCNRLKKIYVPILGSVTRIFSQRGKKHFGKASLSMAVEQGCP